MAASRGIAADQLGPTPPAQHGQKRTFEALSADAVDEVLEVLFIVGSHVTVGAVGVHAAAILHSQIAECLPKST